MKDIAGNSRDHGMVTLTISSLSFVATSKALSLQRGLRHSELIYKVVVEPQPLSRGCVNNLILWNGRGWHLLGAVVMSCGVCVCK